MDTQKFIQRATIVHGNKYDYRDTFYESARNPVVIHCPEHGSFQQSPNDHTSGKGCRECGRMKATNNRTITATANAIKRCITIHQGKYSYDHIPHDIGVSTLISLTCPIHGNFIQTLNIHKQRGCPKCGREQGPGWYSRKRLEMNGLSDVETILYICFVYDENEKFFKIGITKLPLHKRFKEIGKLYEYTMTASASLPMITAAVLERRLKRELKPHRYVPNKKFAGYTECYDSAILSSPSIIPILDSSRSS